MWLLVHGVGVVTGTWCIGVVLLVTDTRCRCGYTGYTGYIGVRVHVAT